MWDPSIYHHAASHLLLPALRETLLFHAIFVARIKYAEAGLDFIRQFLHRLGVSHKDIASIDSYHAGRMSLQK